LERGATLEFAQCIRRLGQLAAAYIALGADPNQIAIEFLESISETTDRLDI